jgi:hypothetical protein
MAIPNYAYLKLKMSRPARVITVGPTYRHTYECNAECVEYAEALLESKALIVDQENLAIEVPDPKRHVGSFELAEATKTQKRKKCLSTSSTRMLRYLCGVPWTCQAYRGKSSSTPWTSAPAPDR